MLLVHCVICGLLCITCPSGGDPLSGVPTVLCASVHPCPLALPRAVAAWDRALLLRHWCLCCCSRRTHRFVLLPRQRPAVPCTDTLLLPGPPSAPRNLVYSLRQSSLVLEWSAPADAGGRSDLTYSLWCSRCPAALRGRCEQCGNGVGFVPQQTGLVDRTVTLVNLLPHVNYTIRVAAVNGVSGVSPLSGQQYAEVNVSTGLTGTAAT